MPYRQRILLANSKPSLTTLLETLLSRHPAHADFTVAATRRHVPVPLNGLTFTTARSYMPVVGDPIESKFGSRGPQQSYRVGAAIGHHA